MQTRKLILFFAILMLSVSAYGQASGSIKGKVRTTKGKSIESVEITARRDGQDIKTVSTSRKGEFTLSGLAPGKYNLVFEKEGFAGGVLYDVEVRSKKRNSLKKNIVMRIDQSTLVLIEASVFSKGGLSIYGAKVTIEAISNDGTSRVVGSGRTSRDGDVLFRFPEGDARYRVTAEVRDTKASKIIEIEGPALYRTAITLDPAEEK
jgi:hypothetical protein